MTNSASLRLERFNLTPPLGEAESDAIFAKAPFAPCEEIRQLYSACNGGYCDPLDLCILPLADTLELAAIYADSIPTMAYWPFLVWDETTSDPCCVSCAGPAAGYVVHLCHDGDHSLKARSMQSFFAEMAKLDSEEWFLTDDHLEFRSDVRASADITSARALLEAAEQRTDERDGFLYLFELAFRLLPDANAEEVATFLRHSRCEVRAIAKSRLQDVSAAATALKDAEAELASFAAQAAEVLQVAGLDAHVVDEKVIRIYPGPVSLSVPVFFDRRNEDDVWDFLVERSKYFLREREEEENGE